mmetsp:Transcript_19073/g.37455  ORF Transcript_19073/g.37455 Transcript_19073/m.37455 type:complete len:681 (+) Transcript_19073:891-2933(+)|eukprot:CAMPEP_0171573884 /NCGR_PEP_ID=MMETSP0961-20121227/5024_1 /TAXON_ID=87120 /ORGANISM="Aurantiochytrium limacinum, Strain ATCCMYA-1381" /LENGTH=680 /DNA_ID=CAMNT_0012129087 /DNA_START=825 /DNA_END=2867 /DNA_ORIENTATION=+
MGREQLDEVRESLRGVDVVRVRNALITHSFVASKFVAESEDLAGADVGDHTSLTNSSSMSSISTIHAKENTVDPYLREVLQALMDLLLPSDICRLLTALDIANPSDPKSKRGADRGKTVSAAQFTSSIGVGRSLLHRATSLPDMIEVGKKRQRKEYFVALISNRTHSGVEEDALFVLRAHTKPSKGLNAASKIIRKTKSLKRFSWKRGEKDDSMPKLSPGRASVERDTGSFVGKSLSKAPTSDVRLSIVKVFPIWSDLRISLKGRGLVRLTSAGDSMRIGTVSIRSMWRLVMTLMRARAIAKNNNFFPQGPSHKWIEIYLQGLPAGAMPPGLESEPRHKLPRNERGEYTAKPSMESMTGDSLDEEDDDDIEDIENSSYMLDSILEDGIILDPNSLGYVGNRVPHDGIDEHNEDAGDTSDEEDDDTDAATSISVHTTMSALGLVEDEDEDDHLVIPASRSRGRPSHIDVNSRLSMNAIIQAEQEVIDEIRHIMQTSINLDELTTLQVMQRLEAKFGRDMMSNFKKSFIDEKIIQIYGQQEPPSRIVAGLYLGTEYNASDFSMLQDIGVTTIINVTKEIKDFFPGHFEYHRIPVKDHESSDLHHYFANACVDIARARAEGRTVFVHCQRGISRSATIVIAFLMQSRRLSYNDAFTLVKKNRPIIKPNKGFIKQLQAFEEELN